MRCRPRIVRGGRPSVISMSAPIEARGEAIRPIGRPEREASPTRVLSKGRPAKTPASSRIVVPELPQSSGPSAARSPSRPRPRTNRLGMPSAPRRSSRHSASTPRAWRQASVERGSAASENPTISLSPSASAEKRAARWATDLSAGSAGVPARAAAGWTVTRAIGRPPRGGSGGGVTPERSRRGATWPGRPRRGRRRSTRAGGPRRRRARCRPRGGKRRRCRSRPAREPWRTW